MAEQYPGPYATLLLSDLGANILMVERPSGGDPARQFPAFFEALNRGKRSLALDLKRPEGKNVFVRLADRADVLFEGFRPGTMARLGLDYARLVERNPRLVYVSISGFGQDGPYRDRPAHDVCYQATAGLLPEGAAATAGYAPQVFIGDLSAGMFAALGAQAALLARERTARGSYVDVSMTDGLVSLMTTGLVPAINRTGPPGLPTDPGYGTFQCADGRSLALGVAHEDRFWDRLCSVLGLTEAIGLPHQERVERRSELVEQIAAALVRRSRAEWESLLLAADIPFGPVQDLLEVAADPQVRARGMLTAVEADASRPRRTFVRQPLSFDSCAPGPRGHAPMLGEHTRAALAELGYSDREADDLIRVGIAAEPANGNNPAPV